MNVHTHRSHGRASHSAPRSAEPRATRLASQRPFVTVTLWPSHASELQRRRGRSETASRRPEHRGEQRSGCHPMIVERLDAVVQDRVLRGEVRRIGVQPRVDVLRPNRNDAPIVPRCRDLGRRLIGDRRERQQVRLAGPRPPRPEAGDQHVLSRPRFELQHHVLGRFIGAEFASLSTMPVHVFIERVDDGNAVCVAKDALPEPFKVVPPRVVPEPPNR